MVWSAISDSPIVVPLSLKTPLMVTHSLIFDAPTAASGCQSLVREQFGHHAHLIGWSSVLVPESGHRHQQVAHTVCSRGLPPAGGASVSLEPYL